MFVLNHYQYLIQIYQYNHISYFVALFNIHFEVRKCILDKKKIVKSTYFSATQISLANHTSCPYSNKENYVRNLFAVLLNLKSIIILKNL